MSNPPASRVSGRTISAPGTRLQGVGALVTARRFEVVHGHVESGRFAAAAYAGDNFPGGFAYGMPRAVAVFRIKLAQATPAVASATA